MPAPPQAVYKEVAALLAGEAVKGAVEDVKAGKDKGAADEGGDMMMEGEEMMGAVDEKEA